MSLSAPLRTSRGRGGRRLVAVVLSVTVATAGVARARPALAEECGVPAGARAELGAIDATARLTFLRTVMNDQARRARTWKWAWVGIGSAVTAGNFAFAAITTSKDNRVDGIIAGAASTTIPLLALLFPMAVESDGPLLEELVARSEGAVSRCIVLERAEALFAHGADDEELRAGWLAHVAVVVANAALAALFGFGLHHWGAAASNGIGGVVLGELQIFTQPTGAVDAWRSYREGALAPAAVTPRVSVVGASVMLSF